MSLTPSLQTLFYVLFVVTFIYLPTHYADAAIEYYHGRSCAVNVCSSKMVCESAICKLKPGQPCGNTSWCQNGTVCNQKCSLEFDQNCTSFENECDTGLQCDPTSSTCLLSPGGNCAGTRQTKCATGETCESDVCRLNLDKDCSGSNSALCQTALTCDSSNNFKCRYSVGTNCSANTDRCVTGSTCQSDICKTNVGGSCSGTLSAHCSAGTMCDSSGVCKLVVDEVCAGANATQCQTGTVCDSGTCKLDLDWNCEGTLSNSCKTGLLCDGGSCKLAVGGSCYGGRNSKCVTGTTCDLYICKLKAGGNCSGANWPYCTCGSICENNVCKLDAAQSCDGFATHCRNGTTCQNGVCRLEHKQNCASYSGYCMAGTTCDSSLCKTRAGEVCVTTLDCVGNSSCDGSSPSCVCTPGYLTDLASGLCLYSTSAPFNESLVVILAALLSSFLAGQGQLVWTFRRLWKEQ